MIENKFLTKKETIKSDIVRTCEICPKNFKEESCTYCKFFLLYNKGITDIDDYSDPYLDEFEYSVSEQDLDQFLGEEVSPVKLPQREPSQKDSLTDDLKESTKTKISKKENKKTKTKKPKETKIGASNSRYFAIKKKIKQKTKKILDLTVYRRRESIFLNGLKNASITNTLIEPNLFTNSLEKDIQEKVCEDINTIRVRQKSVRSFKGSSKQNSELTKNKNHSLIRNIGIISLLCFLLLPRFLWSPDLKYLNNFSFLTSILLWTFLIVSFYCIIFSLKRLLIRKPKNKPKFFCKTSLQRSLKALKSKWIDFNHYPKSADYFYQYFNKKTNVNEISNADSLNKRTESQDVCKSTTKRGLFDLLTDLFYSKTPYRLKETIKNNSPKLRIVKSEIAKFNNTLTVSKKIENLDEEVKEQSSSITVPIATKEDLQKIKTLNEDIKLKSLHIVHYHDLESREEYDKRTEQRYEEKKKAELSELIELEKKKEIDRRRRKKLVSESDYKISIVNSLKNWFLERKQRKNKIIKLQVDQYFKGKRVKNGKTEYCSKEELEVRTEIRAVVRGHVLEDKKWYQEKLKALYANKKEELNGRKAISEHFTIKTFVPILLKLLTPVAILLLAIIVFISSDKLLFTQDIILSFDFLIVLIPALYINIVTAKLILTKKRTIVLASIPALTLLGTIILVTTGLETYVGFLVLASVITSSVLVSNQVKTNKAKKSKSPQRSTDYYRVLYHKNKFFLLGTILLILLLVFVNLFILAPQSLPLPGILIIAFTVLLTVKSKSHIRKLLVLRKKKKYKAKNVSRKSFIILYEDRNVRAALLIMIFLIIMPLLFTVNSMVSIETPFMSFGKVDQNNRIEASSVDFSTLNYAQDFSSLDDISINDQLVVRALISTSIGESAIMRVRIIPERIPGVYDYESNPDTKKLVEHGMRLEYDVLSEYTIGALIDADYYTSIELNDLNLLPGQYRVECYYSIRTGWSMRSANAEIYALTLGKDNLKILPTEPFDLGVNYGAVYTFEDTEENLWDSYFDGKLVNSVNEPISGKNLDLFLEINDKYEKIATVTTDSSGDFYYHHRIYGWVEERMLAKIEYKEEDLLHKNLIHEEYAGLESPVDGDWFFFDRDGDGYPDWKYSLYDLLNVRISSVEDYLTFFVDFEENNPNDTIHNLLGVLEGNTTWTFGQYGLAISLDGDGNIVLGGIETIGTSIYAAYANISYEFGPSGTQSFNTGYNFTGTTATVSQGSSIEWTDPNNALSQDGSSASSYIEIGGVTQIATPTVDNFTSISSYGDLELINNNNSTLASVYTSGGSGSSTRETVSIINVAGADQNWLNPTLATTENDQYATAAIKKNKKSDLLRADSFNFGIPDNADIVGVVVKIKKKASALSSIKDLHVNLVIGGVTQGDDRFSLIPWSTINRYEIYGGMGDDWNAGLNYTEVNGNNFGVEIQAQNVGSSTTTASIDHIEVTVYYSLTGSNDLLSEVEWRPTESVGTMDYLRWDYFSTEETVTFEVWDWTQSQYEATPTGNPLDLQAYPEYNSSDNRIKVRFEGTDSDTPFTVDIDQLVINYTTPVLPTVSDWIRCTNFDFDIPTTATITGIVVEIDRHASQDGQNSIRDNYIKLRDSSGPVGDNRAITDWWDTSDDNSYTVYGDMMDDWNAGLLPIDINNNIDFGVDIAVENARDSNTAYIDAVRMKINYTVDISREQGSDIVRPDEDVITQWNSSEVSSHYNLLNENITQSELPETGSGFIFTSSSAGPSFIVDEINTTSFSVQGGDITEITVWVFGNETHINSTINVYCGSWLVAKQLNMELGQEWYSYTWSVPDLSQANLDGMKIEFKSEKPTEGGTPTYEDFDYVRYGDVLDESLGLSSSNDEFTITAWVNPASLSSNISDNGVKNVFFSKEGNVELGISESGYLMVYFNTENGPDTIAEYGAGNIPNADWTFIAVRYFDGGNNVDVFINDAWYANSTGIPEPWEGGGKLDDGGNLVIGCELLNYTCFTGELDEISVFNASISNAEVLEHKTKIIPPILDFFAEFTEGEPDTSTFDTVHNFEGMLEGGATWATPNGVYFDGLGDIIFGGSTTTYGTSIYSAYADVSYEYDIGGIFNEVNSPITTTNENRTIGGGPSENQRDMPLQWDSFTMVGYTTRNVGDLEYNDANETRIGRISGSEIPMFVVEAIWSPTLPVSSMDNLLYDYRFLFGMGTDVSSSFSILNFNTPEWEVISTNEQDSGNFSLTSDYYNATTNEVMVKWEGSDMFDFPEVAYVVNVYIDMIRIDYTSDDSTPANTGYNSASSITSVDRGAEDWVSPGNAGEQNDTQTSSFLQTKWNDTPAEGEFDTTKGLLSPYGDLEDTDDANATISSAYTGGGSSEYVIQPSAFNDVFSKWSSESSAYDQNNGTSSTEDQSRIINDIYWQDWNNAGSGNIIEVDIRLYLDLNGLSNDRLDVYVYVGASQSVTTYRVNSGNDGLGLYINLNDVIEPNDGTWTWADVGNIEVRFDGTKSGGHDSVSDYAVYEIWGVVYTDGGAESHDLESIAEWNITDSTILSMDYLRWDYFSTEESITFEVWDWVENEGQFEAKTGTFLDSTASEYYDQTGDTYTIKVRFSGTDSLSAFSLDIDQLRFECTTSKESDWLRLANFGFDLPSDATVTGIIVNLIGMQVFQVRYKIIL